MKIVDNILEGRHISEACQYCTSTKRQEYFDVQSVFRFADNPMISHNPFSRSESPQD